MSDPISPAGNPVQVLTTPVPATSPPASTESGQAQALTAKTASKQEASKAAILEINQAQTGKTHDGLAEPMTVEQAAQEFRTYLKNLPSDLQFRVDKASGYIVFKVVNPVTQEVIRQYPPDEVLEMAKRLKASANQENNGSGIFLDGNV